MVRDILKEDISANSKEAHGMKMCNVKAAFAGSVFTLVMAASAASSAEEKKGKSDLTSNWDVVVGLGAGYGPDYEGSDDYEFSPLPLLEITWRDRIYLSTHDGLGAYFYKGDQLSLKGGIGYDDGRDEGDNSHLRGLGNVDGAVALNAGLEYELGPVTSFIELEKSLGGSDGLQIEFGVETMIPLGGTKGKGGDDDFSGPALMLGISADWVDDNYAESYFGVNATQSARSGLARYNAESGFKSVNFEAGFLYPFNEHWALNTTIGYSQLLGDAADSPIVKDEGQFFGGVFVTYQF